MLVMKKSSTKAFEAKSPKVLIPIGLAAASVLTYFTVGNDTAKQVVSPTPTIELAQPEARPGVIPMSEIGKIVLANDTYTETIYACVTKTASNENFLIDRVVLNAPVRINSEFGTGLIDRSKKNNTGRIIHNPTEQNMWGVGDNAANTNSQQMIMDPKSNNFVTFYGSWNGTNSTVGDAGALEPIQVPSKQIPKC